MPIRVVIGEDDVLLREGIAEILERAEFDVVARTGNADDFLRRSEAHRPDVAVVDIQMPPGNADDGLRAALALRASVLREMAEGKSNRGIAETLFISEAAVEKHVTAIFRKLGIEATATEHRRVLAVVQYLRASGESHPGPLRDRASSS
jgi:DNA-binding NarL/FixJ family response regulator